MGLLPNAILTAIPEFRPLVPKMFSAYPADKHQTLFIICADRLEILKFRLKSAFGNSPIMTKLKILIGLFLGFAVLFNGARLALAQTCSDVVGGVDYCPSISGGTRCTIYGTMPSCGSAASEIPPAEHTALGCDTCVFSCASGWVDCDSNIRLNGCERANPIGGSCTLGGQAGTYTGNPCSPTCTVTPRFVSRQYTSPGTAEEGYINIKGNVRITPKDDGTQGDLYFNSGKAIRVGGGDRTSLRIESDSRASGARTKLSIAGNLSVGVDDSGATRFSLDEEMGSIWVEHNIFANGNISTSGNLTAGSINLGGVVRSTWPAESQWFNSTGGNIYYNMGKVSIGTDWPPEGSNWFRVRGDAQIDGRFTVTNGIGGRGNIDFSSSSLGVLLGLEDRPLITRRGDLFTAGNYQGAGRWGIFMEPRTLTIGTPSIAGNGKVQFARYDADSTIASVSMYIDENGRVGIGTTAPDSQLHVSSSSAWPGLKVQGMNSGSGVDGLRIQASGRQYNIGVGGASNPDGIADKLFIWDATAAAQRLVIDRDGNVGIGTNNPTAKLDVKSLGVGAPGAISGITDSGDQAGVFGENTIISGGGGDGVVGRTHASGKSGVYGYSNNRNGGNGVYGRSWSDTGAGVGAENLGDGPALQIGEGRISIRPVNEGVSLREVPSSVYSYSGEVSINGAIGTVTILGTRFEESRYARILIYNNYVRSDSQIFITISKTGSSLPPGSLPPGSIVDLQGNGYFQVRLSYIREGFRIHFLVVN